MCQCIMGMVTTYLAAILIFFDNNSEFNFSYLHYFIEKQVCKITAKWKPNRKNIYTTLYLRLQNFQENRYSLFIQ